MWLREVLQSVSAVISLKGFAVKIRASESLDFGNEQQELNKRFYDVRGNIDNNIICPEVEISHLVPEKV